MSSVPSHFDPTVRASVGRNGVNVDVAMMVTNTGTTSLVVNEGRGSLGGAEACLLGTSENRMCQLQENLSALKVEAGHLGRVS